MGFAGHRRTRIHCGPAPVPEPGAPQGLIDDDEGPVNEPTGQLLPPAANTPPAAPKLPTRFAPGDVVCGKYEIVRLLGDGGMGSVYEAMHVDLDRPVALKVLLPELTNNSHVVELFRSEAKTVSRIGADEIVQLFDFAELPDGRMMFTMELLEGPTLAEVIEAGRPSPNRIISILRGLCTGLSAAHAAGVVHRDVKPDNIVLENRRRREIVKILDFGIATMLDDTSTAAPIPAGTPMYLAPELIRHEEFDHRADIYSVGCVAYELCTGHPPFPQRPGEGFAEILRRQIDEVPSPMKVADDGEAVPEVLERIVMRCLAKCPENRYPDLDELESDLCEAQIQLALTSPLDDVAPAEESEEGSFFELEHDAEAPPSVLRKERRGLWPLLAGTSLVAALAAGFMAFTAEPQTEVVVKEVPVPVEVERDSAEVTEAPAPDPEETAAALAVVTSSNTERAARRGRRASHGRPATEENDATDALIAAQLADSGGELPGVEGADAQETEEAEQPADDKAAKSAEKPADPADAQESAPEPEAD